LLSCSAIADPSQGGSAMAVTVAVQNLTKPRRETPCWRNISPTVARDFKRHPSRETRR
jgi:hypothetical protein